MSNYILKKITDNFKSLIAIDEKKILGYKKASIYVYNIDDDSFEKIVKLPQNSFWRFSFSLKDFRKNSSVGT